MAERLNAAVLKTVGHVSVPGVESPSLRQFCELSEPEGLAVKADIPGFEPARGRSRVNARAFAGAARKARTRRGGVRAP